MSDFVSRLLGAGDADAPPIRPSIGSLFEPRRPMRLRPPHDEPPLLPGRFEPSRSDRAEASPPAGAHGLPTEPYDVPPPPAGLTAERAAPERAPERPQAVGAGPPAVPERPTEPAAFALPKPRRSGTAAPDDAPDVPRDATRDAPEGVPQGVPEEQHATPAEPRLPDTLTTTAPDPVRARPVPASLVDPLLAPRRERAAAAPNVRITIGRVEVRANRQPPAPQPPRRIPGRRPAMSLEDYLRTRSEGGGAR
ncbi:hypothetical protein ACWCXH_07630 [Kitasatospora sp. NPDC001660]